jgi:asparagine synthase (glutamine-hydrolysing)
MCGIFGSVNTLFDNSVLDLIKRRGPDDSGIEEVHVNGNIVRFGHRRLSIIDLSPAGHQPMFSECGNYMIILNGEIYNHLELREKLPKEIKFKGHSDTETVLYYIIKHGIESIRDFNGIFAFAFYNKTASLIYLVRDRYGVKPLYYYCDGGRIIFSSEIRPINRIIDSPLDTNALSLLLNLRYCPSPVTLFKGINKLRPGHYAKIDLNKKLLSINANPYINIDRHTLKITFLDAIEEYGRLLEHAVDRQLMSDVEVGILLSGGIDSALVAGIAAKKLPYKPKAFTIGFNSKFHVNEIGLARETADHFGLEHFYARIESSHFFDLFEECSGIVEEPLATTSFIPLYFLSKLASEQVKVVLSGQGADETLGGYGRYQGEIIRERYPKFIFNIASHLVRLSHTKNEQLIRGANSLSITGDIERFANIYSLNNPEEIKLLTGSEKLVSSDFIKYYYELLKCSLMPTSVDRMMAIDLNMNLPDDLLMYTDKITMHFSLECRVPMLDMQLVDFLGDLPQSYKVRRFKTKIIHKEYAKRCLPESIISRPKYGFQSPTDIWFRQESGHIREILLSDSNILLNYLNKKEVEKLLMMHAKGYNKEKQIFLLLSLSFWLKSNQIAVT